MTQQPARKPPSPDTVAAESSLVVEMREIDRQLASLVRNTDRTAHAIIDAAERMAGLSTWMDPTKRKAFEAELASVLEACAFGDVFGQRLAKSQAALLRLATRLGEETAAAGADAPADPDALDQTAIDRMFR